MPALASAVTQLGSHVQSAWTALNNLGTGSEKDPLKPYYKSEGRINYHRVAPYALEDRPSHVRKYRQASPQLPTAPTAPTKPVAPTFNHPSVFLSGDNYNLNHGCNLNYDERLCFAVQESRTGENFLACTITNQHDPETQTDSQHEHEVTFYNATVPGGVLSHEGNWCCERYNSTFLKNDDVPRLGYSFFCNTPVTQQKTGCESLSSNPNSNNDGGECSSGFSRNPNKYRQVSLDAPLNEFKDRIQADCNQVKSYCNYLKQEEAYQKDYADYLRANETYHQDLNNYLEYLKTTTQPTAPTTPRPPRITGAPLATPLDFNSAVGISLGSSTALAVLIGTGVIGGFYATHRYLVKRAMAKTSTPEPRNPPPNQTDHPFEVETGF